MASVLLGEPNSLPTGPSHVKPKKKLPPVAFYVLGSAIPLSIGLTIVFLPFIRQAMRAAYRPQFMSNRHMPVLASGRINSLPSLRPSLLASTSSVPAPESVTKPPVPGYSHASLAAENPIDIDEIKTIESIETMDVGPFESPELLQSRAFNDREEKSLYGAPLMIPEGTPDPDRSKVHVKLGGAMLGAKAFAYATAIVVGFTGVGLWAVGRALGTYTAAEFGDKMRDQLAHQMPELVGSVNRPGRSLDGLDGEAIDEWMKDLEASDAEEEAKAV